MLKKLAGGKRLSGKQKRLLAEYRQRSDEHRRAIELLSNKEWMDEQRKIGTRPIPRAAIRAAVYSQVQFVEEPPTVPLWKRNAVRWVAAACVILGIAGWLFFHHGEGPRDVARRANLPARNAQFQYGSTTVLTTDSAGLLPDGSVICLRAGAQLTFPRQRGIHDTFELSGVAYFQAAKNPGSPLIVRTSDRSVVKVLGTNFYVDAKGPMNLTLFSGSVIVQAKGTSVQLRPGEQALVKQGKLKVGAGADSLQLMDWARKAMSFDFGNGVNFGVAIGEVAQFYGCTVVNERNLPGLEIGGVLGKISVDDLLKKINILEVGHLTLRRTGKQILVLPYEPV